MCSCSANARPGQFRPCPLGAAFLSQRNGSAWRLGPRNPPWTCGKPPVSALAAAMAWRVYSARSCTAITPQIHIKASLLPPPTPPTGAKGQNCTQVRFSLGWIHVPADVVSLSHSCVNLQRKSSLRPPPTPRPPRGSCSLKTNMLIMFGADRSFH